MLSTYRSQSIDFHSKSIDCFLYEANTGIQWVNQDVKWVLVIYNDYSILRSRPHLSFENSEINTAWKVSKYGVISGPYFPVFGLNMEIHEVNLRIQSEYRKIRTRNNSVFGHISRSENVLNSSSFTALRIVAKFHSGDRWFSDNFSENRS